MHLKLVLAFLKYPNPVFERDSPETSETLNFTLDRLLMKLVALWVIILIPPALFGLLCAYYVKGRLGPYVAGIIPWLGLLFYLLYFEPGWWQVVQLFVGTAVAGTGVISYSLFRDFLKMKS